MHFYTVAHKNERVKNSLRDSTKMSARGRGRPRSFDSDAVMRVISNTFRDGGFSATSLDDIAGATGLNRPSLYAAFGDKRSMYLEALRRLIPHIESLGAQVDPARPLASKLKAMCSTSIDGYLSGENGARGCLAVGTAAAEAVHDPEIRHALREFLLTCDRLVAGWFAAAGYDDADDRAAMFCSAVHALGIRARAGQKREALEAIAAKLCDQALL